jgi:dTDP-4-dehydrorhamnose 3,5-epimerase
MKVLEVKSLSIQDIKVIKFARFNDHRGYFTEPYRKSDMFQLPETAFLHGCEFVQTNESYSKKNTIRGLHFQWNPFMGKLVRTVSGRMVDIILDIRKNSPTFGKIIAYDMPNSPDAAESEWIWVPPGFAHGNFFVENSLIEYFCTGEYSPGCEAGISPLSKDLDWSLCDPRLKTVFEEIAQSPLITDKDRDGFSVSSWSDDERSEIFQYTNLCGVG